MSTQFNWVVNKVKFDRAKKIANSEDEQAIKKVYASIGGLIKEDLTKVVDQQLLDENPELAQAGVELGSRIEEADQPQQIIEKPKIKYTRKPKQEDAIQE